MGVDVDGFLQKTREDKDVREGERGEKREALIE